MQNYWEGDRAGRGMLLVPGGFAQNNVGLSKTLQIMLYQGV